MKSLVLVFCLAQLWGCHATSPPLVGLPNPGLGYRALNCDDPESEQAALVAVDYLNKNLLRGYKHTLNQIDKVKVWPRVSEPPVYELKEPLWSLTARLRRSHLSAKMKLQRGRL